LTTGVALPNGAGEGDGSWAPAAGASSAQAVKHAQKRATAKRVGMRACYGMHRRGPTPFGEDRKVRIRSLLAPAGILAVTLFTPAPAGAAKICAFAVPTTMLDKVFSGTAKSGQPFRFRVSEDTVLDDGTQIPAGTTGYGIISEASPASRGNKDGLIALEPRYLVVSKPNGGVMRVQVTMNPTLPVVWTPNVPLLRAAANDLPIPGIIMSGVNSVRWGRNITLGSGFTFSVVAVDNLERGPVC
jgi:hypothetical protein